MRILILANMDMGLYKFRGELLEALVKKHEVFICVPDGEYVKKMETMGCHFFQCSVLDRRGTNPIKDLKLIKFYKETLKEICPDVVLTYTIKPNVYGGWLCGRLCIPYISNVTGLGTSIENGGMMQKITLKLYKEGLKRAHVIFFQNRSNRDFMIGRGIVKKESADLLPGSGVNIDQYCYEQYPDDSEKIIFTTIGRIMKDKGIDELLRAAEIFKNQCANTEFRLIGDFDEGYEDQIREFDRRGIIRYLGFRKDIRPLIAESHAIIHASYHEGMSNVLQEAASTGRPVIAADVHGCVEAFDDGITGISFKAKSVDSIVKALERFMSLSREERIAMGRAGRKKMEMEFNRTIVVNKYLDEINIIEKIREEE